VQSLVRAFGILDLIGKNPRGLTLTKIASLAGLPRSTAHRLLTTMGSMGYVEFDPTTNHWLVGLQAFTTGNACQRTQNLTRVGRPVMRSVMSDLLNTVNLSVPRPEGVCFVAQAEPLGAMGTPARPGVHLPMHTTASGKLFLSNRTPNEIDSFLKTEALTPKTQRTIVERNTLFEQLRLTKVRGYSVDDQENAYGVRCIAAPIFDANGETQASLSVSAPIQHVPEDRIAKIAETLVAAAARITASVGGHA
jgi:IclR family acetate operon transcriptional repressor